VTSCQTAFPKSDWEPLHRFELSNLTIEGARYECSRRDLLYRTDEDLLHQYARRLRKGIYQRLRQIFPIIASNCAQRSAIAPATFAPNSVRTAPGSITATRIPVAKFSLHSASWKPPPRTSSRCTPTSSRRRSVRPRWRQSRSSRPPAAQQRDGATSAMEHAITIDVDHACSVGRITPLERRPHAQDRIVEQEVEPTIRSRRRAASTTRTPSVTVVRPLHRSRYALR
jgi:hypothetical protein